MHRSAAFSLIAALTLVGCTISDEGADAGGETEDAEAMDMTPEGPSLASRLLGGGEPMPLDIQQAHPYGTVLQVRSLQIKPSETIITAIVTNGDDREVALNQYGRDDTYIATGDGQKLYLSPPAANEQVTIPPGQRMEAELVFLGELRGEGGTLIVNEGNQTGNQHSQTPGFRIPLPIEDAAFSNDGSKKN